MLFYFINLDLEGIVVFVDVEDFVVKMMEIIMKNYMMMSTKRVKARGRVVVDNLDDEICDVVVYEDVTS